MENQIILTSRLDESTGELGYAIDGLSPSLEFSASTTGLLIAHDIIEHQNGASKIGPIIDELEAIGAIWFGRGAQNVLRKEGYQHYSTHESLAFDLSRMARDCLYVDESLFVAPNEALEDEEEELLAILAHAKDQAKEELTQDDLEGTEEHLAKYWSACLPAMRNGYRKAEKRFGSSFEMANQFWAISDTLDPIVKDPEIEGRQILLTWGNGDAKCEELEPEYDEYY